MDFRTLFGSAALIALSIAAPAPALAAEPAPGAIPPGFERGAMASIHPLRLVKNGDLDNTKPDLTVPSGDGYIGAVPVDPASNYGAWVRGVAAPTAGHRVGYRIDGFLLLGQPGDVDVRVRVEPSGGLEGYACTTEIKVGDESEGLVPRGGIINSKERALVSELSVLDVGQNGIKPFSTWLACGVSGERGGVTPASDLSIYGLGEGKPSDKGNSVLTVTIETRKPGGQWTTANVVREIVPESAKQSLAATLAASKSGGSGTRMTVGGKTATASAQASPGWSTVVSAGKAHWTKFNTLPDGDVRTLKGYYVADGVVGEGKNGSAPEGVIRISADGIDLSNDIVTINAKSKIKTTVDGEYVIGVAQKSAGKGAMKCVGELKVDGRSIAIVGALDAKQTGNSAFGAFNAPPGEYDAEFNAVCLLEAGRGPNDFAILARTPTGVSAIPASGLFTQPKE